MRSILDNQHKALVGWKAIAIMFGVSPQTMVSRRKELLEAGAIFYLKTGQSKRKMVCAFPSRLKAWIIEKSSRGEVF